MREHPILFSTPMVRAILSGSKTQTRLVMKSQPYTLRTEGFGYGTKAGGFVSIQSEHCLNECPYGKPGDRLWVTQDAYGVWKNTSLEERFWSRVYKFDCWEWFGLVDRKGYGRIKRGGKQISAHRLAWEFVNGPVPEGKHVLHFCDVRHCVNPAHLRLGTNEENIADKVSRFRTRRQCGEDNGAAVLNKACVLSIRRLAAGGWLQRDIADRHGITQSQVSRVLSGKRWGGDSNTATLNLGHRTLEITEVRVQRLQEISEEDALAEGITKCDGKFAGCYMTEGMPVDKGWSGVSAICAFHRLWTALNGPTSWDANPWVWALTFERRAA